MAQGATNLNVPPPVDIPVAEAGKSAFGRLTERWRAWFTALAEVADWHVTGDLDVDGDATVSGALTAGNLTLTDAGTPPFDGVLYAGDAAWHVVGAAGEPAFINGWSDLGGAFGATRFRRLSTGLVILKLGVTRNPTAATAAFQLPAGYRPGDILCFTSSNNGGFYTTTDIGANGDVVPNSPAIGALNWVNTICFYAEA